MPALITFLSDYGYGGEFVGVCHGVIARRCPEARVIDIAHAIPRHDIRAGALALAAALPYMPAGVHLAVVDPGVGSTRRALALRLVGEERLLVGPDNGLLAPSWERFGGVAEAVDVGRSPARLEPVSATFHGRDIFAPVAAALAAGEPLAALGDPVDPATLVGLEIPGARLRDEALLVHALGQDHFGNLMLNATGAQLAELGARPGERLVIELPGRSHTARYGSAFAEVPAGELLLYEDSRGMAALAVNRGSAAQLLAAEGAGVELIVRRA
jgi:S-adenosyl-L-methionine hydrolase (adenosine-forming)